MNSFFQKINKKTVIKDIVMFIVSFIFFMTLAHFFRFPTVDGTSMYPTYNSGDHLIVLYTHNVDDNDIAVIWSDQVNEYIVKRVIGVAGDHIEIKDGKLYRNGNALYESYINEQNWAQTIENIDITVPDGQVFVLGDNRNESADSRILGLLDTKDIFGKVLVNLSRKVE